MGVSEPKGSYSKLPQESIKRPETAADDQQQPGISGLVIAPEEYTTPKPSYRSWLITRLLALKLACGAAFLADYLWPDGPHGTKEYGCVAALMLLPTAICWVPYAVKRAKSALVYLYILCQIVLIAFSLWYAGNPYGFLVISMLFLIAELTAWGVSLRLAQPTTAPSGHLCLARTQFWSALVYGSLVGVVVINLLNLAIYDIVEHFHPEIRKYWVQIFVEFLIIPSSLALVTSALLNAYFLLELEAYYNHVAAETLARAIRGQTPCWMVAHMQSFRI